MDIIKKQEITSVGHDMTATDWEIIFANDISNKILHIYIYIAGDGIDHRDHKESKGIPEKHILLFR